MILGYKSNNFEIYGKFYWYGYYKSIRIIVMKEEIVVLDVYIKLVIFLVEKLSIVYLEYVFLFYGLYG